MVSEVILEPRVSIDVHAIYMMRQAGASLAQIAEEIGRTKERVRQILVKHYGSTKRNLLSTEQLCQELGIPRKRILKLSKAGIITPITSWTTGKHHFLLWSSSAKEKIIRHEKSHKLCRICRKSIPAGRWVYCSDECYLEGQKYRNKSEEVKRRRLLSIKKSINKRKRRQQAELLLEKIQEPSREPAIVH